MFRVKSKYVFVIAFCMLSLTACAAFIGGMQKPSTLSERIARDGPLKQSDIEVD